MAKKKRIPKVGDHVSVTGRKGAFILLKYEEFLSMQKQLISVLDTIAILTDESEVGGIMSGVIEMEAGRTKSIAEIRASLKKKSKEKV